MAKRIKKSHWLLAQLVYALETEYEDSPTKNKTLKACLTSAQDYLDSKGFKKYAPRSNPRIKVKPELTTMLGLENQI